MNIVYCSSNKYSEVFAVSVLSLFESNKEVEDLTVYLIDNGINEVNKERIAQIANFYGRQIEFIPLLSPESLKNVNLSFPTGVDFATYGRLFLVSHLPKDINKAIYLDCDTIIQKPLVELWNTDISGYFVGMVDDGHSSAYRKPLGIPPDGTYYSAGVMLVNLKAWRENNIEKEFVGYIQSQDGYIPICDQGVANAVFDGKILRLPLKYNVYTLIYAFSYDELVNLRSIKNHYYSEEEVRSARDDPVIVHFMYNFYMPIRPWEKGSVHPYTKEYLEHRDRTAWKYSPLWEDGRSKVKKLYTSFCHSIPKPLAVSISKIIHEHFIPVMHRYKKWIHTWKT